MKKYSIGIISITILLIGVWYFGFNNQNNNKNISTNITQEENKALLITTSFYPLQFVTERIVGEYGVVINIGEGKNPHSFKPSTQDMLTLNQSDLVVLQGAGFELWGDDVRTFLNASNVPVIVVADHIKLRESGEHHDEHKESYDNDQHDHDDKNEDKEEYEHNIYDPHTWLDPVLFSEIAEHIAEKIIALDPTNKSAYQKNVETLKNELTELDSMYSKKLAHCKLDEVIVSHAAFGYIADRYNFSIHAIAGLSTQDTPSATTLSELKEEAEEGVGAILLEENNITEYGEILARETGLETLSVNPIAYIIPEGDDYMTLMKNNLDTFSKALICDE